MRTTLRAALGFAVVLVLGLSAIGCNTTEGFGRDMQSGGRKIEREAQEHK